jgi:hypothetical protein
MNVRKSTSPSSTKPHGKNGKLSQRGMLSIVMLLVSVSGLGLALLGGAKLAHDILSPVRDTHVNLFTAVVALGIAYGVGWLTAMVSIRVYGNLILPIIVKWFMWVCIAGICFLYIEILERLFDQKYDFMGFVKYSVVIVTGLFSLVGLHLIIEDHNLRPYAIPLLLIAMVQLGLIVYRHVFVGDTSFVYLLGDLTFLAGMSVFSIFTLAHVGLLNPLRTNFTNYFDRNSVSIRSQD